MPVKISVQSLNLSEFLEKFHTNIKQLGNFNNHFYCDITSMVYSDECYIGERGGFLKYICPVYNLDGHHKIANNYSCHNTNEFYQLDQYGSLIGQVCSQDPHFYQACDKRLRGYRATNTDIFCENYVCKADGIVEHLHLLANLRVIGLVCNKQKDCKGGVEEEGGSGGRGRGRDKGFFRNFMMCRVLLLDGAMISRMFE